MHDPPSMGMSYQIIATVLAWLNLAEGQHLELEAGEDFDLVEPTAAIEVSGACELLCSS
jgi:hypothetical protein